MINEERWQELKEKLKKKFPDFKLEQQVSQEPPVTKEIIFLTLPRQDLKLIWSKHPRVVDKKTHYSNRAGGETKVDYEYAADEFVYNLEAEELVGNNWQKIDLTEIIQYFS